MREDDYDEFAELIDAAYDLIGKTAAAKMIGAGAKMIYFQALTDYPLPVVRTALAAHCMDKKVGHFTPSPAHIIEKIEAVANRDNRPGCEEAWALALRSCDEQATIVWTRECAEAFARARPVLDASGPISARKTFLEIYDRLIGEARQKRILPEWFASPGLDKDAMQASVKDGVARGLLLSQKPDMLLIKATATPETFSLSPRQQLDFLYKSIAAGNAAKQARLYAASDARNAEEDRIGADIQRQVDQRLADEELAAQLELERMRRAAP